MSRVQILDREYSRVKEVLEQIASDEVLGLVKELELIIEGKCIQQEIEAMEKSYRRTKDGE